MELSDGKRMEKWLLECAPWLTMSNVKHWWFQTHLFPIFEGSIWSFAKTKKARETKTPTKKLRHNTLLRLRTPYFCNFYNSAPTQRIDLNSIEL